MYVKYHIIFGLIFAGFFYLIFNIGIVGFFIIFLSSFLIDVDHYIYYAFKKKSIDLKQAYNYFMKNEEKMLSYPRKQRNQIYGGHCILHGVEFVLILFLLSFFSKYVLYILLGVAFHLLLDITYQTTYWDRLDKVSFIWDYLKFKKFKHIEHI